MWEDGLLGNRTHIWRDPQLAYASGAPGIGFRELRFGGAGAGAWERVPRENVFTTHQRWRALGRDFVMDPGAPDSHQTILGEITRTYRGLEGYIGAAKVPMRVAMAQGLLLPRSGATVIALLDRFMDSSSRDDIDALLELYPDATIEFACFDIDVGVIPGRNTLIWEVRNY